MCARATKNASNRTVYKYKLIAIFMIFVLGTPGRSIISARLRRHPAAQDSRAYHTYAERDHGTEESP